MECREWRGVVGGKEVGRREQDSKKEMVLA